MTASRDGTVKVWDVRALNDGPVAVFSPEDSNQSAPVTRRDCWAACFGDCSSSEDRCVLAGFDNGDLKLFDLRNACVRFETTLPNGVVCVEFDRPDIEANKFVVTTLEGEVTVFDARTLHPEKGTRRTKASVKTKKFLQLMMVDFFFMSAHSWTILNVFSLFICGVHFWVELRP